MVRQHFPFSAMPYRCGTKRVSSRHSTAGKSFSTISKLLCFSFKKMFYFWMNWRKNMSRRCACGWDQICTFSFMMPYRPKQCCDRKCVWTNRSYIMLFARHSAVTDCSRLVANIGATIGNCCNLHWKIPPFPVISQFLIIICVNFAPSNWRTRQTMANHLTYIYRRMCACCRCFWRQHLDRNGRTNRNIVTVSKSK